MSALALSPTEERMLDGREGEGVALAMRVVAASARALGARKLLPISSAHIDGCLFVGEAGLHFAERLSTSGARVSVPTSLNVSSLDLLHPELFRGSAATAKAARRLMSAYEDMGCRPTWTCAPYQLPTRPAFGEHIAWAESNAIAFANSVLGARTNRYGDFIDICAAVTGRVPYAGFHVTEERRGQVVFDVGHLPARLLNMDTMFAVLGFHVGATAGAQSSGGCGFARRHRGPAEGIWRFCGDCWFRWSVSHRWRDP